MRFGEHVPGARSRRLSHKAPALLLDLWGLPNTISASSLHRRLRRGYAGAAFRIRRASDSVERDIPFNDADFVDWRVVDAFCAGTNGFVVTAYDQGAGGYDLTQVVTSNQPKVFDSVTGRVVNATGKPSAYFDGADSLQSTYAGTSLTGTSPALSTAIAMQAISLPGTRVASAFGTNSAGGHWAVAVTTTSTEVTATASGRNRTFTCNAITDSHGYTIQKAVNATASAFTATQDGTTLAEASVTSGGSGLSLASHVVRWGAASSGANLEMYSNLHIIVQKDLSATELLHLQYEFGFHA